ncbi:MAG: CYTH domain-containing protein [Patescibacteria group bacterium]|nr:CYTH domain-containing protein [Patescibacteria group bacterium]
MQQYEVEIKSLLGSEENAETLRERMKIVDPNWRLTSRNKQLNHYFLGGDFAKLAALVAPHLSPEAFKKLQDIVARLAGQSGNEFSVRTRDKDGSVLLVVKVSLGEDTSQNGVARMEFEEKANLNLDDLDQMLISAGFQYQAKWSREREEYAVNGVSICLDRNAGYGWLAEFEKVVGSEAEVEPARQEVRALMEQFGARELEQERLERMFAFYNAHWSEYYGTDKVFTVR